MVAAGYSSSLVMSHCTTVMVVDLAATFPTFGMAIVAMVVCEAATGASAYLDHHIEVLHTSESVDCISITDEAEAKAATTAAAVTIQCTVITTACILLGSSKA